MDAFKGIYISGPVTGVDNYLEKFNATEKHLKELDLGFKLFNPARENLNRPERSNYHDILRLCLDELDVCDAIYMMPGWEFSKGARLEFAYADAMGYTLMGKVKMCQECRFWDERSSTTGTCKRENSSHYDEITFRHGMCGLFEPGKYNA